MAVIVVIEPGGAGCPSAGICHPRALSDVSEGAVSIVVVQNAPAISKNKQVREAIIVVIAHSHTHAEKTFRSYACFLRNVAESAVAIVTIQSASQGAFWLIDSRCRSVSQVQIQQSILVIVNPSAA